ncbi:MAG: YggU family protein [Candidatus Omnitrophica bacterium]|nr:YggU family protein [Candidatus Omnitrophota bacterium]
MADIAIRVKPRSSRQAILGLKEDVWQIALNSPPEGGKANKELLKLLGKILGVPASSLALVSGEKSRNKRVRIPTLSENDIVSRLTLASSSET